MSAPHSLAPAGRTLCLECHKPLRIFTKRTDFNGREYHFKCWYELVQQRKAERELIKYLEMMKRDIENEKLE